MSSCESLLGNHHIEKQFSVRNQILQVSQDDNHNPLDRLLLTQVFDSLFVLFTSVSIEACVVKACIALVHSAMHEVAEHRVAF